MLRHVRLHFVSWVSLGRVLRCAFGARWDGCTIIMYWRCFYERNKHNLYWPLKWLTFASDHVQSHHRYFNCQPMDSISLQYLLVTYFHRNRAGRPKKEFALSLVIESTRNNCFVATTSRHPSSDSCRDKPLSPIAGYWLTVGLSIVWAKKPKAEVLRPPPPPLLSKPWLKGD